MPLKKIQRDTKRLRNTERLLRAVSNHRRLEIMEYLAKHPELSIFEISDHLYVNFKTISGHMKRLSDAGLVMKRNQGASVRHRLTEKGEKILTLVHSMMEL